MQQGEENTFFKKVLLPLLHTHTYTHAKAKGWTRQRFQRMTGNPRRARFVIIFIVFTVLIFKIKEELKH